MVKKVRRAYVVQGQVQGVGFRPFVWRLAREEGLTGSVGNTSAGVRIEVQGSLRAVEAFGRRLRQEPPPLARITRLEREELAARPEESAFVIGQSQGHAGQNVLVSADVAVCAACLADMADPANRRYRYPFTNCTNCGPRFSITRSIPYDRPATVMACFPLCSECAAEYADPADRRFHAQPIACRQCGPQLWFVSGEDAEAGRTEPSAANSRDAIARAAALIAAGGILALRGLGGFQLVCDAQGAAVGELRRRKNRPHKALAVMMRALADVRQYSSLTPDHENLLTGTAKPIVLCPVKAAYKEFLEPLAPDCAQLGVMLPYTPLHHLLMEELARAGIHAVVMTSANPQGEPITLGNREALRRLRPLADGWLLHNRDILCRIDDSVVAVDAAGSIFLRRARGYVPEPVPLATSGPCALGAGADLKNTFCLTRGSDAFLGQHIGDLRHIACMDFYDEALAHLQRLLEARPELIVHDLHPDFFSTRKAQELAVKIPAIALQHHVAHAAACLGEHGVTEPSLALCLDGSGLGTDGAIWGGEMLLVDLTGPRWQRLGSLSPFFLPGGEAAIAQPWRIAVALQWQNGHSLWDGEEAKVARMLEAGVNCPRTSSCGRLFDAVAAHLGLCRAITYEAQAAMRLEKAAALCAEKTPLAGGLLPLREENDLILLDSAAIFAQANHWLRRGKDAGQIALSFHHWLANGFAAMAARAAARHKITTIALSGGVMHNGLLRQMLMARLRAAGLKPLLHSNPGDGGLSLGQALWGQRLLASGTWGLEQSATSVEGVFEALYEGKWQNAEKAI